MGKMTHQIILLSFILLLFHGAGILPESGLSLLLNLILNPEVIATSSLFSRIAASFVTIGIGITASFFLSGQNTILILRAGVVTLLFEFVFDLILIFKLLAELNGFLALAVISSIMITFGFTTFEWFTGRD